MDSNAKTQRVNLEILAYPIMKLSLVLIQRKDAKTQRREESILRHYYKTKIGLLSDYIKSSLVWIQRRGAETQRREESILKTKNGLFASLRLCVFALNQHSSSGHNVLQRLCVFALNQHSSSRHNVLQRLCVSALNLIFFSIFVINYSTLYGDPWGKDADIANNCYIPSCEVCVSRTPFLGPFAEAMIRFHQEVISPADGPRSNFMPSSSQYALDAIKKYGFFQGVSMGCDRLMRENKDPWVYHVTRDGSGKLIKYDPIP